MTENRQDKSVHAVFRLYTTQEVVADMLTRHLPLENEVLVIGRETQYKVLRRTWTLEPQRDGLTDAMRDWTVYVDLVGA